METRPAPNGPVEALPGLPDHEVLQELGRGGMGVVYLATNKVMGRKEVLKVVNQQMLTEPGAMERFLQEIRSAAQLSHPNIVTAHAVLRSGDSLVLAMEHIVGENLYTLVTTHGPLPVANACYYAHQAALGLQHAFDRGMVHRDIKPDNLMLARDGKKHTVKILDFGLAKATRGNEEKQHNLTGDGKMMGTPDYIAPEQILDAAKADIRADIYSLGCTLYFLLAGAPPFKEGSLYEKLQAHMSKKPTSVHKLRKQVPVELAAIVDKMMAKDVEDRFQKPGEVAQALVPFVTGVQSLAVPDGKARPAGKTTTLGGKTAGDANTRVQGKTHKTTAGVSPKKTQIESNTPDLIKVQPKPAKGKLGLLLGVGFGALFLCLLPLCLIGASFGGVILWKSEDPKPVPIAARDAEELVVKPEPKIVQPDESDVVRNALDKLGRGPGTDFSRLVKGLDHKDFRMRDQARTGLTAYTGLWWQQKVGPFKTADVDSLLRLLSPGDDVSLRTMAVAGLGQLSPNAAPAVPMDQAIDLMASPHLDVQGAAEKILRQKLSAKVTPKDLPALRKGLQNKALQVQVRIEIIDAVRSLKKQGNDALPELVPLIGSWNYEESARAILAVDEMGKLVEIAAANPKPGPSILGPVLKALRKKAVRTKEALALYEANLEHLDRGVQDLAALAMLDLAWERLWRDRLSNLAVSTTDEVRMLAEKRLREKLATVADLRILREGLKNKYWNVRVAYIDAIGALKEKGEAAYADLAPLTASDEGVESARAIAALDDLGKLVHAAGESKDAKVLVPVLSALRTKRERSNAAFEAYAKNLGHEDDRVKNLAALILLDNGPERLQLDQLAEFMSRPNAELRGAASKELRQKLETVNEKDLPAIRRALKHPSRDARLALIGKVGSFKDKGRDAVPELADLLQSADNEIFAAAARTLAGMEKAAAKAVKDLEKVAAGNDESRAALAAIALSKIERTSAELQSKGKGIRALVKTLHPNQPLSGEAAAALLELGAPAVDHVVGGLIEPNGANPGGMEPIDLRVQKAEARLAAYKLMKEFAERAKNDKELAKVLIKYQEKFNKRWVPDEDSLLAKVKKQMVLPEQTQLFVDTARAATQAYTAITKVPR